MKASGAGGPLVNGGKLENYLVGREPVRDFAESNGHGRAAVAVRRGLLSE